MKLMPISTTVDENKICTWKTYKRKSREAYILLRFAHNFRADNDKRKKKLTFKAN